MSRNRPAARTGPRRPPPAVRDVEFRLLGEYVELNQLLKLAGACGSGGAGKRRVAAGEVTVDGAVELRKTCKIRAGQVVRVDDLRIRVAGARAE